MLKKRKTNEDKKLRIIQLDLAAKIIVLVTVIFGFILVIIRQN